MRDNQGHIEALPTSMFDKSTIVCSIVAPVCCLLTVGSSSQHITVVVLSCLLVAVQLVSSIGFGLRFSDQIKAIAFSAIFIPFPLTSIIIYLFDTNSTFRIWFVDKMTPICNINTRPLVLQIFNKSSIFHITQTCHNQKHYSLKMKLFYFYKQYFMFIVQIIVFYIPSWYVCISTIQNI